ncbi:MAG: thioredoxin domain-containing protein [Clostridiales bacterium]|nr:thioredoxin domain-containing protein [Clostridiales bacterium]
MKNHLSDQTSPYLLQHAENPVDWYPWGEEAFIKAKREDKPVFLSIGYSACHWCHVMAKESFENEETAALLNESFVSVKVDREERPDVDNVYMNACTLFSGSGGWPASIFMTPDKKPFFAGTYFPKKTTYGMTGFDDLLRLIRDKWQYDRAAVENTGEFALQHLREEEERNGSAREKRTEYPDYQFIKKAVLYLKKSFDKLYGGFGNAPKFPMAHNLLFLLDYYEKSGDTEILGMVEKTLIQMYRGGLYDHIGSGFSRYSTDRYFLVPHFEKMLYDNALLIMAYIRAYSITNNLLYRTIAEKTAHYVLREMTDEEGAFYSAQDADSDGEEGKYYLLDYNEILQLLGDEDGLRFCSAYGITKEGNFKGKNIPNLLQKNAYRQLPEELTARVYEYRKARVKLNTDDKILTSSCSLMIAALATLYRVTGTDFYLESAVRAEHFLEKHLTEENTVYVSTRQGRRGAKGFLADYAFYLYALLHLHEALPSGAYLVRASSLCKETIRKFHDPEHGGFYLYGEDGEALITRPKETYDGALPSGNSVMAYVLIKLSNLLQEKYFQEETKKQVDFLCGSCAEYPTGSCFFLSAFMQYLDPPEHIVCVTKHPEDARQLPLKLQLGMDLIVCNPTKEQPLLDDKTTFYVCKGRTCYPPSNHLEDLIDLRNEY